MFFMFKFTIYFAISFAILCIPFGQGDSRIFDALYNYTRPYANEVVKTTKQKITTTTRYSKKLFSNSSPSATNDEVSLRKSAIQKEDNLEDEMGGDAYSEESLDDIPTKEKDEILKSLE